MCVPSPEKPAAPATINPSLPSADALELGGAAGVPRGAALLGRLKLRVGGAAGATKAGSATQATPGALPADTAGSVGTGTPGGGFGPIDTSGVGESIRSNAQLIRPL